MQLSCPQCGTRDIKVSQRRTFREAVRGLVGIYPIRCRRCSARWETSVWEDGAWKYARCPKCYRQQLTTWSEHYYNPPTWTQFMLRIGATPYRCAACRCNFASFKRCKEKFAWRHQERQAPGALPDQHEPDPESLRSLQALSRSTLETDAPATDTALSDQAEAAEVAAPKLRRSA